MDAGHFLTLPDDFKDVYEEEEVQEDNYDDYYESDGDGSGFYCKKCNHRSFTTRGRLLEHIHLHTGIKRFNCDFCDAGFNNKYKLGQHIIVRHSSNPNPNYCNLCERGFSRSDHLRRHLQFHYGKKDPVTDHKFLCPVCLLEFKDEKEINTHIKDHVDEAHKNIPNEHKICVLCNTVLTCRTISAHMSSCHMVTDTVKIDITYDKIERLKFACSLCDFSGRTKKKLSDHFRKHQNRTSAEINGGPWRCTYCDKVYTRKSDLKRHTLMHTIERPPIVLEYDNQCPKCGLIKGKRHRQNCKGKKPFACDLCHQSFHRRDYLVAHMKEGNHSNYATVRQRDMVKKEVRDDRTVCPKCDCLSRKIHQKNCKGKKKYQCHHCPKSFNVKWNLNKHLSNFHSDVKVINLGLLAKCLKTESHTESLIEHAKLDVAAENSTLVEKKSTPVTKIKIESITTAATPSNASKANATTATSATAIDTTTPSKTSARSGRTIVTPKKYTQDYFDSDLQDFKVEHSNLDQIIEDFQEGEDNMGLEESNEEGQETINDEGLEAINEEGQETINNETENMNDVKSLIEHTSSQSKNKRKRAFVCPKCDCVLKDARHVENCKGKRKYQCDLCPKSYNKNNNLNVHKRKKHPTASTILDFRMLTKSERLAIANYDASINDDDVANEIKPVKLLTPNKVGDGKSAGKNSNLNSHKRKKTAATASNVIIDDEQDVDDSYIPPEVYMDNAESDIEENPGKADESFSCYFCWRTFSDLTDARLHILTQHASKNPRNVRVDLPKLNAKTLLKYMI